MNDSVKSHSSSNAGRLRRRRARIPSRVVAHLLGGFGLVGVFSAASGCTGFPLTNPTSSQPRMSVSDSGSEKTAVGQKGVSVAVIGGFASPESMYQVFIDDVRARGHEALFIQTPATPAQMFRQDLMLENVIESIEADLPPESELLLVGHSLGGKLVAILSLFFANDDKRAEELAEDVEFAPELVKAIGRLQKRIRGILLLDPVEGGLDLHLTDLTPGLLNGLPGFIQKSMGRYFPDLESDGIFLNMSSRELLDQLDKTLVRLRPEKLGTTYAAMERLPPFQVAVVEAGRGVISKPLNEIVAAVQSLRPRSDHPFFKTFRKLEQTLAANIQSGLNTLGMQALPSCAPETAHTLSGEKASGPISFWERFEKHPRTQFFERDGFADSARPGYMHLPEAGHMDVVDLNPFRHRNHIQFYVTCTSQVAEEGKGSASNPALDTSRSLLRSMLQGL